MDEQYVFWLTLISAVGSGLIAGLFYTFSVFQMKALAQLPAAQGMAAMQSINRAILNPTFLATFMGTVFTSAALVVLAIVTIDPPARNWVLAGGLLYLVGVFLVTGGYHVPRNEALDKEDPASPGAAEHWARYVKEWTAMNHVRTLSSLGALVCFIMAIRVG